MSRKPAAEQYDERRRRILAEETCIKPISDHGIFEIILASPREYDLAMSSLGFQNVFQQLASWPETCCERAFYPEPDELHWRSRYHHPIVTLESGKSIKQCDLLAFTLSSEYDYIRMLRMMSLAGIKLRSEDRTEKWPLLIAGGITVTANPLPLSLFVDAFVIGETEPSIGPVLDTIKSLGAQGASKKKLLRRLASLPGMYIPSVHEIPGKVSSIMRQWAGVDGLGSMSTIRYSGCIHGETTLIEISRGCPYNCKFCQSGYVSLPYRESKVEDMEDLINGLKDVKMVTLLGSSPRSHPDLKKIIKIARDRQLEVSLVSNKAEGHSQLQEMMVDLSKKALVLAPETGNDSLRKVIGKKLNNSQMYSSVEKHADGSAKSIRIYFMIGLPFETESDREAIFEFVKEVRSRTSLPIHVNINPFIPKPWTAFQWCAMANPIDLRDWMKDFEKRFKKIKGVKVKSEDPRKAHIRALLTRGDHRISMVLEEKLSGVGRNTAFKKHGINIRWVFEELNPEDSFEWDFLNMGFGHTRLSREYHASISAHQNRMKMSEKSPGTEDV